MQPIGRGCFVFDNYCIQEGHYVHIRDTRVTNEEEEVVGGGQEDEGEKMSPREGYPKGIKPMWRPKKILPYSAGLIPSDPMLPRNPPSIAPSIEEIQVEDTLEPTNSVQIKDTSSDVEQKEESQDGVEESSPEQTSPTIEDENPTSPDYTGNCYFLLMER